MDPVLVAAGFGVGIVVGLTGMGGGALMTPVLVLFFGVPPLTAVSSDLVASAVMKPVGAAVHIRRRTVHWSLVGWLCLGSVPTAFAGALVLRALGGGDRLQEAVRTSLGVALLIAAGGLTYRAYLQLSERAARRRAAAAGVVPPTSAAAGPLLARPVPTVVIGAVGGLIVGMTSVGSGSLIIIALLMVYPLLRPGHLVGTDLVQAVPLVSAAAVGHLLFGEFEFDVTAALLVGAVPGTWLGAQLSSRAPAGLVRRALALVLVTSGLKLLGVSNLGILATLGAVVLLGPLVWMVVRRIHGLPALARNEVKPEVPPAGAPSPSPSPPPPPADAPSVRPADADQRQVDADQRQGAELPVRGERVGGDLGA
jgi:hypothetical protein